MCFINLPYGEGTLAYLTIHLKQRFVVYFSFMYRAYRIIYRRLSMANVNWPLTLVTGNPNKLREALQILGKEYENKVFFFNFWANFFLL